MYVTDSVRLAEVTTDARLGGIVAFDAEFMRERTYYARLCLAQIATPDQCFVIDPVAIEDLGPLFDLLNDASVQKVVHAGSQDLEIVFQRTGRVPAPVFDTQLAAAVAGFPLQVSYAALAQELLGETLPKSHRYSDWCRRPLLKEQLDYAEDDVRHLIPLYEELTRRLESKGRLEWIRSDLERLSDPSAYEVDERRSYLRVKGRSRLDRRGLGVLREIAAWREQEARRRDVPRKWVLQDESLIEVARRRPSTRDELEGVRGLSERLRSSAAERLLGAVRIGVTLPDDELPRREQGTAERHDAAVVDLLSAVLRSVARKHGVAVQSLATRDEVERLAAGEREGLPLLEGWRREHAGDELLAVLEGRRTVRVDSGGITVESPEAIGE